MPINITVKGNTKVDLRTKVTVQGYAVCEAGKVKGKFYSNTCLINAITVGCYSNVTI